ncbi:MAG TPA: lipase family protein [Actinomycetota bacterium]
MVIGVAVALLMSSGGPATAGTLAPAAPAASPAAGDVVQAQPTTIHLDPLGLLPVPVRAWHVLYRSTSALGRPDVVSGTLLVPFLPYGGDRPIIGYAPGTHGMGDQCAPSQKLADGQDVELLVIGQFLLRGWAVAVTDYEGLGTPGDHTYAVGISEGHAVLDVARAASRVGGAGLSPDAPVVLYGYSQGGQAAGWAAQQAASYAPDLPVKGVAAGGVPADLVRVLHNLEGTSEFGLAFAAGAGFDTAYPELHLEHYLNPRGQAALDRIRGECSDSELGGLSLSDLTTSDPMTTPAWQARLRENRLGAVAPKMPVLLYHGEADEIIPYGVGTTLKDDWCAKGAALTWVSYAGASHVGAAAEGSLMVTDWIHRLLFGDDIPNSC